MSQALPEPREKRLHFPVAYGAILERLNQVDPSGYAKTRNFTDGAVTYLSPYISRGVISGKQVWESVLSKGVPPGAALKLLQELSWREFYQRTWQAKGEDMFSDVKQPQSGVFHYNMVHAIATAATGILAVDAAIKEFYDTGYLHNHVRMYVASIACNIARAHWSQPARWMYYHLLDGDIASNTCSWQWVAGTFSSKKYFCNQENINWFTHSHQANTFLDVHAEDLERMPTPEVLKYTVPLNLTTALPSTRKPDINIEWPTLIYNSYNLDPLWRKDERVNRILLLEPSHFRKYPVTEKVIKFITGLASNIPGCQLVVGEVSELNDAYRNAPIGRKALISKEHPAFQHYPGIKDQRDWICPEVTGDFNSFFSFWKACERSGQSHHPAFLKS